VIDVGPFSHPAYITWWQWLLLHVRNTIPTLQSFDPTTLAWTAHRASQFRPSTSLTGYDCPWAVSPLSAGPTNPSTAQGDMLFQGITGLIYPPFSSVCASRSIASPTCKCPLTAVTSKRTLPKVRPHVSLQVLATRV
jgi:hypothetical protein